MQHFVVLGFDLTFNEPSSSVAVVGHRCNKRSSGFHLQRVLEKSDWHSVSTYVHPLKGRNLAHNLCHCRHVLRGEEYFLEVISGVLEICDHSLWRGFILRFQSVEVALKSWLRLTPMRSSP